VSRDHAGREVLDHYVDRGNQIANDRVTKQIFEVDADALLAAVLLNEVTAAAVAEVRRRERSPPGGNSILITSAPISAIIRVTVGPASSCEKLSTL
jgi:anti-sigma factor RsiW